MREVMNMKGANLPERLYLFIYFLQATKIEKKTQTQHPTLQLYLSVTNVYISFLGPTSGSRCLTLDAEVISAAQLQRLCCCLSP